MAEFFPDEDEEEADGAAPAVDASGQYAFQSDGESISLTSVADDQLLRPKVVSTSARDRLVYLYSWTFSPSVPSALPLCTVCVSSLYFDLPTLASIIKLANGETMTHETT